MNGKQLDFTTASVRWIGIVLSYLTLAIGFFIIGFTDKKQGPHDFIARTVVVQSS